MRLAKVPIRVTIKADRTGGRSTRTSNPRCDLSPARLSRKGHCGMNLCRSMTLVAAIVLGACGGGGNAVPPPGGGDGGGGSGDPTPNGTGEIGFPWARSSATSPTITIRGTAADPDGVASVSVNGIAATITATGSAATCHSSPRPVSRKAKRSGLPSSSSRTARTNSSSLSKTRLAMSPRRSRRPRYATSKSPSRSPSTPTERVLSG